MKLSDWDSASVSWTGSIAYSTGSPKTLQFPAIETEVRRALMRRFPYSIYFTVLPERIVVIAVLHVRRYPQEWQSRV